MRCFFYYCIGVFSLLFSSFISCIADDDIYSEIYFGRLPSARSEAMGRAMVASYDGVYTAFFNPANVVLQNEFAVGHSHVDPLSHLGDVNYNFVGIKIPMKEFGAVGFQLYKLTVYSDPWDTYPSCFLIELSSSYYTLFYAKKVLNKFAFGINLNYLKQDFLEYGVYPIDVGLQKLFKLNTIHNFHQEINIGTTIKNIRGSKGTPFRSGNTSGKKYLPVLFFCGASYKLLHVHNNCSLILNLEYEDVLNYQYYTGLKFGTEISLFYYLQFRFGYYQYSLDSERSISDEFYSPIIPKNNLEDITYGLGIKFPVLFSEDQLNVQFDITSLRQHSYQADSEKRLNFTVYSVQFIWN